MLYPQRPGRCQTQTRSINGGEGRLSFEVLHFIIGSIIYSVTLLYINLRSAFLFTPRKHIKFRQRTLGFPFISKSLVNTGYLHERSSWVHTLTHTQINACGRGQHAKGALSSPSSAACSDLFPAPKPAGKWPEQAGAGPGLAPLRARHKRGAGTRAPPAPGAGACLVPPAFLRAIF